MADSKDSVWSTVAGVGRLESAAYAGRNGTAAANLYLYLYKVVSLGGNVEVPGLNIPLSGASLDSTLFRGLGGSPAALQFLTLKQRGAVISEVAIPAMPPVRFGRIPAFVDRNVNTGVAITNSSNSAVSVTFTLTQADGAVAGNTGVTINPNRHIVAFISDRLFGAGSSFDGTLTWRASAPLSVVAIRGRTNERSEFLMSVLPVADLDNPSDLAALVPHFADGGGWSTELKLANPADVSIRGALESNLRIDGVAGSGPIRVH